MQSCCTKWTDRPYIPFWDEWNSVLPMDGVVVHFFDSLLRTDVRYGPTALMLFDQ